ncbi:alpha/beta fold hydrolase [Streptomyces sp. NPDC086081]|uniref:alpha/beta fold hydrolase n=1 Tax=Streptomyces sp. NPDC086081 TaxID=3365749 RepID=UPI00380F5CD8
MESSPPCTHPGFAGTSRPAELATTRDLAAASTPARLRPRPHREHPNLARAPRCRHSRATPARPCRTPPCSDGLPRVDVPVHVIWGDSDGIVDAEYGKAFAAAIPAARFTLLPHSGHLPQIETPGALLGALLTN